MRRPRTLAPSMQPKPPAGGGGAHAVRASPSSASVETALRNSARSVVLQAIGPQCATDPLKPSPPRLTRPNVGLIPKTPLSAAGMRIDPPPSPAVAIGASPMATPTADPV